MGAREMPWETFKFEMRKLTPRGPLTNQERLAFDLILRIMNHVLDTTRRPLVIVSSNKDIAVIIRDLGIPDFAMGVGELGKHGNCGWHHGLVVAGGIESSDVDLREGNDWIIVSGVRSSAGVFL
jgi:hypothetical protein